MKRIYIHPHNKNIGEKAFSSRRKGGDELKKKKRNNKNEKRKRLGCRKKKKKRNGGGYAMLKEGKNDERKENIVRFTFLHLLCPPPITALISSFLWCYILWEKGRPLKRDEEKTKSRVEFCAMEKTRKVEIYIEAKQTREWTIFTCDLHTSWSLLLPSPTIQVGWVLPQIPPRYSMLFARSRLRSLQLQYTRTYICIYIKKFNIYFTYTH